jgi:hypothetical protein
VITAVDTNVLLDVLGADPTFGQVSRRWLIQARSQGSLVACEAVWSEVVGFFPDSNQALAALEAIGLQYQALEREAALRAGAAWKAYRSRGGSRQRVLADFLIGAHAQIQSDRLLTRDSGYFRTYFPELKLFG